MLEINLSGKTVLITGGGQGLGAATAAALARGGARVAINYLSDAEGVNLRRAELTARALGPEAAIFPADVRSLVEVQEMVRAVLERFGRLDVVVNNAGILRDHSLKKLEPADWQSVIDTNLTGVYNVCKAVVEVLAEGGRIINMSSLAAVMGFYGQANYAAAKAGVVGLTRVLSREMAKRRITVNAVAPGVVLTEMGRAIDEAARAEMLRSIALGRFAEPEEIAAVVSFLASDLASYVTGQVIHVNGGWWG
jgi:3-oxoacyl-[acyl-carrier protein] reductase